MKERMRLIAALEAFHEAMKARALAKECEGFEGWDDGCYALDMAKRMRRKVGRVMQSKAEAKDLVDIANFAAFLWWQLREKGGER